ncbi:DUF7222 domain-containing protein [Terrihalobacillus insolitus]|uniref:DUF7222 domain-containing protein n=1 Tax=Terrihalobacillus insolitus TaxID=2950438 RepID=UPI0023400374|nr:hypothetical protein [Terrihalobacillus insolitus]MDC3413974.1 hypothetical protein [Terrihalobacillus insolitus]
MKTYEFLKEQAKGEGIIAEVANFIVESTDNDEEAKVLLEDIVRFGCVSGAVGDMIYYSQTHQFFDEHYEEIEELREEFEFQVDADSDLKNTLAWFAYEVKAHELLAMVE